MKNLRGNLTFTGTSGNDTLNGTADNDLLQGLAGNDILNGGLGADITDGGTGDDWHFVDNAGDVVVEAVGEGNDRVFASVSYTLPTNAEVEVLSTDYNPGTTPINLTGNAFNQAVFGNAGANILDGGGGVDVMVGFAGDDIYYVDNVSDRALENVGEGNDRIFASVSYALAAGSSIETLSTDFHAGTTAINFTGNELANTIIGNDGVNTLEGGAGADILIGRAGNDILNGGTGADVTDGGTGDDFHFVDNAGDVVQEAVGEGNDRVFASVSYVLTAGAEVELITTDFSAGTAAINLTGNAFNQAIFGNAGANILDGAGGVDVMIGLAGDDIYYVDNVSDRALENVGEGTDRIFATVSYALAAGSSIETLSTDFHAGTTAINFTGNELANTIIGNDGVNTLEGGDGADSLVGRAGNDTLNGGAGIDTMDGGAGDDLIYVDNAADVVIEAAGGGNDRVLASVSYTLAAGVEVELLTTDFNSGTGAIDLTGNELANTLFGNAGANALNGGGGADTLVGFGGDDIYYVDSAADQVVEAAGQGNDQVVASVSYTLAAGVSVETLSASSGTAAINLTGNELANIIIGNAGSNVLTGGAGPDTFVFNTPLGAGNIDTITDFTIGQFDIIRLAGSAGEPFAALAAGHLQIGTLVIGTAALDDNDYLIYNNVTGALLYDADGSGAGAAVQFATLSAGLNLNLSNFEVSGPPNSAPTITSGTTASVAENSSASTIVYQTVASDADGDRINYTLGGTDASFFTIDASGAVRLIAPANFEAKSSYSFNVFAADSADTSFKTVTLTIIDVVENATPIINETAAANDTRQTAQALNLADFVIAANPNLVNASYPSVEIHGSISAPNDTAGTSTDVDFYSITLQAGQQLILDVDGTNGLDSFLSLYGPSGVLIGDNDDQITFDPGSVATIASHNTDSEIIFRAATAGTYYFSIKSFADDAGQASSKGSYTLNVSINSTPATAAQIMGEDVDALISGASWNHSGPAFNLTYGFPGQASYYPSNFPEVSSEGGTDPTPTFDAFNPSQQAATRSLLQLIANVTQITFTENTAQGAYNVAGTAANANLRYAETTEADVAYAYYPTNGGPSSQGGSAWFNYKPSGLAPFDNPQRGNYAWMGVLHETGHALGLKHGHEFPLAISADHDSIEYSVMTYRSYPGGSTSGGYTNETWGYAQTLMMLDIAALQKIYGSANYAFNAGNSVYTWSATTGEMSINGIGQGAPGNNDGITEANENRVFMTIWDGGGNDTYDLSNYATNTIVDLRPGEWTTTSGTQLANLNGNGSGGPIFARGNVANALLFEGNPVSLIENAKGGSGADTLIANQVANQLTGNLGTDTFKWMATGDAGTGALADTVTDFVRGADKIDFTNLDANPATAAHNAFTFIGTSAFHNVAGEVRYDVTGGSAHIFADADGNGTADMEIILTNITTLATTDFNF